MYGMASEEAAPMKQVTAAAARSVRTRRSALASRWSKPRKRVCHRLARGVVCGKGKRQSHSPRQNSKRGVQTEDREKPSVEVECETSERERREFELRPISGAPRLSSASRFEVSISTPLLGKCEGGRRSEREGGLKRTGKEPSGR
eukprot:scaffold99131_cov25-Tisochrysis_lutea.AAC.4